MIEPPRTIKKQTKANQRQEIKVACVNQRDFPLFWEIIILLVT